MTRREKLRDAVRTGWARLRGGAVSPERAAAAVAVGLFVGCTPFYGLQTFLLLSLTIPLRLDTPVAWLVTNVANPLTMPFILLLEIEVGAWLLEGRFVDVAINHISVKTLGEFAGYALLGSAVVCTVVAALGGSIALVWLRRTARLRGALVHSTTRTPST